MLLKELSQTYCPFRGHSVFVDQIFDAIRNTQCFGCEDAIDRIVESTTWEGTDSLKIPPFLRFEASLDRIMHGFYFGIRNCVAGEVLVLKRRVW
ncbi:hypothetical protein AVEN_267551-1 [Araneus ventricosus]|uniref:Uncharacterized protein n=1 Tax=Araneus ventricosus TaxID=182803 RepID=A0A4Y2K4Y9_ARAVE|nr:hypothetical protein AVEN_193955-1 [Araneus ventricosus]GBM96865.1 hypothetical protein AVEN_267551-1 [Araneus ventricosus]